MVVATEGHRYVASEEWVDDVQETEFQEVRVCGVDSFDPVLAQDRGDVGIGNEVSTDDNACRDGGVVIREPFLLGDDPAAREFEELADVFPGCRRRQGGGEYGWVRGDALVGHQGRPGEAEEIGIFRAGEHEIHGGSVLR